MIFRGSFTVILAVLLSVQTPLGADPPARTEAGLESAALSTALRLLQSERAELRTRLEALLDRRLRLLLADPEGGGRELRTRIERARHGAALDFLAGVARQGNSAAGRVAFPLEDVPARARAEATVAGTCLILAAEAFRGGEAGAPDPEHASAFFAAVPPLVLAEVSAAGAQAEAGAERVLILTAAVRAGSGLALVGGLRLSALEGRIQRELAARHGPAAPRWTVFLAPAFLASAGSTDPARGASDFPPRIAIGDEIGKALPRSLALSLASAGQTRWPQPGFGSDGSGAGRGEWLALRDPSGAMVGGMGAVTRNRGAPAGAPLRAKEALLGAGGLRWTLAASIAVVAVGGLLGIFAGSSARRSASAHREARHALLNEFKAAALRQLDPTVLVPQVELSVERAVERAGTRMAASFRETFAEALHARMKHLEQESGPHGAAQPLSPRAALSESILSALLAEQFPLALIGVDANLEIFAWNPAAAKLWGAPAKERVGKRLDTLTFGGIEAEIFDMARAAVEHGTPSPSMQLSFDRDRVYHVEVAAIPLGAAQGNGGVPRRALILASDVSLDIDSEISAKLLGGYQKALSASLPVPIVVTDKGGHVMSWSAAAAQALGIKEGDALGKELSALTIPSVPHSTFPFKGPEGDDRGTLHVYGSAAPLVKAVERPRAPKTAETTADEPSGAEAQETTPAETAAATA